MRFFSHRGGWLRALVPWVWLLLLGEGLAHGAEIPLSDVRHMDRVRIFLRAGGEIEATVGSFLDGVLLLTRGADLLSVPQDLIQRVDLVERADIDVGPRKTPARQVLRPQGRSRGALALSILLPGTGHIALGAKEVGGAFLITDVTILGAAVASLVLNKDPLAVAILLGVDVGLRISSAVSAWKLGREPKFGLYFAPTEEGMVAGMVWTRF